MATQLFLQSTFADVHLGTNNTQLAGAASGWSARSLATTRGAGVVASDATATVAGTTLGVEVTTSTFPIEWISPPVSADVTITGDITANIWAAESNMSANVAINVVIDIIRATDNSIVQIVKSTRVAEVAVTTRAANNFTTGMLAADYTEQTVNRGDRLRIRVFGDDAGTMASGFTFNIGYAGATGGADGDTFVTFTETFSFESAPAGTQLFLTDTASDVSTASVDREAWTSRGAGVVNDVRNTAAGWTAPLQLTDTAGGTVVDWFTKQLQAFTLGGMAQVNLRALESNAAANASLKCEIARVDSDGTNPTVWGSWCIEASTTGAGGEVTTSEAAYECWCSGDDLAFSDGQRIRIRAYVDDAHTAALVTGHTVTFFYNGTSAGASGDTYVILPQSVSEFSPAVFIQLRDPLHLMQAVNRASVW